MFQIASQILILRSLLVLDKKKTKQKGEIRFLYHLSQNGGVSMLCLDFLEHPISVWISMDYGILVLLKNSCAR